MKNFDQELIKEQNTKQLQIAKYTDYTWMNEYEHEYLPQ